MKKPYFDKLERMMMRDDESPGGAMLNFKLALLILFREIYNSLMFWKK